MNEIKPTRKTIEIVYNEDGSEESRTTVTYGIVCGIEKALETEIVGALGTRVLKHNGNFSPPDQYIDTEENFGA